MHFDTRLCKFEATKDEITAARKGGDLYVYKLLAKKRQAFLERNTKTRHEAAAIANVLKVESVKFQSDLVSGNVMKCVQYLRDINRALSSGVCRLLFLSDATASMKDLWDGTIAQ
jgi:hypothetical protein